jgi:hypothetical protein
LLYGLFTAVDSPFEASGSIRDTLWRALSCVDSPYIASVFLT